MKKPTAVSVARNELTIGLDLGDRQHHACVLSAAGEIFREEVLPNTRECVLAFAQRFPGAAFVMETGTHSPWISRLLEAQAHRVIVANARKLRAISQSHTKNDTEDARMLARLTSRMRDKIDTPEGRAIYSQRLGIVEPVFGNIGAQKGMNRSTLRGTVKVNIQWRLYCLVHNLEKVSRAAIMRN